MHNAVPLWRGLIYHNIIYGTGMTGAKFKSEFKLTTDTPYLTGELWGVYCEILEKIDRVIMAAYCM